MPAVCYLLFVGWGLSIVAGGCNVAVVGAWCDVCRVLLVVWCAVLVCAVVLLAVFLFYFA